MAADWEAEGLLEGVEGEEREARIELLDQLAEAGVSTEQLRDAVAGERLAILPVELELEGEGPCYSARDLAERSGLSTDFVVAQHQALGLPRYDLDDQRFNEADLDAAKRMAAFLEAGMPEDGLVEVARVFGRAMSSVAEATRALVAEAYIPSASSERDLGLRFAEVSRQLGPQMGPMLEYVFGLHLREQLRTEVVSRAELVSGRMLPDTRQITVCFADLVGFTRLGAQVPADELGAVAGRLSSLAGEVVEPPVRLVKTIGDAAMLVAPAPPPLLDAALALVEAADAEGDSFPQLRVGMAHGAALNRAGDWYGHPVNLASRITDIARPASVLADASVHDAARDAYRWSRAGERKLKGIAKPVRLYRARPLEPGSAEEDDA